MDFNVKSINPTLWERARIKGIRQKVSLSKVFRRLLEMWVNGEVEVTFPDKKGKGEAK
jgi:hypothetical protein